VNNNRGIGWQSAFDDVIFAVQNDVPEPELTVIKCSACGQKLIELFVVGDGPTSQLIVECPFCGDRSFKVSVRGAFKFAACDNVEITNIQYGDSIIFSTKTSS